MAEELGNNAMEATMAAPANGGGAADSQVNPQEAASRSKKECRVYVGNLSYEVKWNILKDFMREGA